MFVDECEIEVIAGRGGDGMVSFRREKYVAKGGPNGGDGGDGGDVVFEGTTNEHTLMEYRHIKRLEAENGKPGGSKGKTGASAEPKVAKVPVGTVVYDADTGEQLADLTEEGQRVVVAEGGDGGFGNLHFKSSTNQAPRQSTPGEEGETRNVRLEIKLIADVGLVGYPSVGKSTLISTISGAKPKTGDYPFTTQAPNLGVVHWHDHREFVVADCPGLIEGAHRGEGLGIQFLKHVERTDVIAHVIEVQQKMEGVPSDRDPIDDFEAIYHELESYNPQLIERPQRVILNKIDLPWVQERVDELREYFEDEVGIPFVAVSAATGDNLDEMVDQLGSLVYEDSVSDSAEWWEVDLDEAPDDED
jgi:GTP-binding protein